MDERARIILEGIHARRSVRAYQDRPVEREKLEILLRAGMAAPSACNLQIWEFVVVTEKEIMRAVRAATQMGDYNAPAAVVFCADTQNVPWDDEDWRVDLSAAAENMLIAAAAIGLGSVWLGGFDEDALRKILNIPARVKIMNLAYFGYPLKTPPPGDKYDETAVYWQTYEPERGRKLRTIAQLYE